MNIPASAQFIHDCVHTLLYCLVCKQVNKERFREYDDLKAKITITPSSTNMGGGGDGDSRGFSGITFCPAQGGLKGSEPKIFCTAQRPSHWIYFSLLNNKNQGFTISEGGQKVLTSTYKKYTWSKTAASTRKKLRM